MDTFRALAPAQGLKFTPLFLEKTDDDDARFKRLEDAVQALRNDFDTIVPSMVRLVAIEKDMKELVGQLQTLTEQPVEEVPALPQDAVSPPPLPPEDGAQSDSSAQVSAVTKPAAAPSAPAAKVTAPPLLQQQNSGEDVVQSTEAAPMPTPARSDVLATPTSSVTPGAAPKGMPPEGAAPLSIHAPAAEQKPQPPAQAPAVQPPISLTPVKPKNEAAAPKPAPVVSPVSKGTVSAVRIGDHKDKTRIVIETTAEPEANAVMSANGKQIIIDMTGWDWALAKEWLAENSQLVAAWTYKDGKLVIDVIYKSTIKAQQVIQPNGKPDYRLVIDVFCPDVHQ